MVVVVTKTSAGLPLPALTSAGLGLFIGGLMLSQSPQLQRRQGLAVMIAGWSLGLLALWQSHLWLWELNEIWDPRPVAAQIQVLPSDAVVMLDGATRPSLNWYAERPVKELNPNPSASFWLVSKRSRKGCSTVSNRPNPNGWELWHCSADQP